MGFLKKITGFLAFFAAMTTFPASAAPTPSDDTCLFDAATQGDLAGIRAALRGGAHLDARDGKGQTPLIAAAQADQMPAVDLLVHLGASLDTPDMTGRTLTMILAEHDQVAELSSLFTEFGNRLQANAVDRFKHTALTFAAWGGHSRATRILLANGAAKSINLQDEYGFTPLIVACGMPASLAVVGLLIEVPGIEMNLRNSDGMTAVDVAQSFHDNGQDPAKKPIYEAIIEILETHGGRPAD